MKNAYLPFLAFVVLFFISSGATLASETELWRNGISLIPYPQIVEMGGEDFVFEKQIDILIDKAALPDDLFAAEELSRQLNEQWNIECRITEVPSGNCLLLTRQGAPGEMGDQGYRIETSSGRLTIRASGAAGLFYGTQSLLQLIQKGRHGLYVKGMQITDWPDISWRAVHYDTKHFQEKKEYVKGFIRTLATYKINTLIWEWEDKFAYTSHPEVGAPGAFTMEEMQELTRYARKYHIQIVPLVQGLGHASYILKHPQHKHLRELPSSNWQFCPLKEGTYELMFDLYKEAIEATPGSEYIHIGCDEAFPWNKEVGMACGCKAKVEEIGYYGLKQIFLKRCASYVNKLGRRAIAWDWPDELKLENKIKPPPGLTLFSTSQDRNMVQKAREAGYPVWYYDLNPGIEHLFLPYFYKIRKGKKVPGCLERSCKLVPSAARLGIFDGMVATSWNCSGVHNQGWMLRYITAAEYSWSGKGPDPGEFEDKYFTNYYGPGSRDVKELFILLNKGSYYYMDAFEHKVWHWGDVGKTHLPDLPRDDIEYDPYWNSEYKEMVDRSRFQLGQMERALDICRSNLRLGDKNSYDFELFTSLAELFAHTARTYLALSDLENAINEAHRRHFSSREAAYQALKRAERTIVKNLAEREEVFSLITITWEKSQLPRGMSTPEKKYVHGRDQQRNFANRRPDLSFMIYDEQLLGLEKYLEQLQDYIDWYNETYL